MTRRLISIGMPVFNGGEALRRALDCLLAQTDPDFELIISDNCSTDGLTEKITNEYAKPIDAATVQSGTFRELQLGPGSDTWRLLYVGRP